MEQRRQKKQRKKAVENENPEDFIDPDTPNGRKKLLAPQMAKQYSPSAVEKSYDILFFLHLSNL